MGLNGTGSKNLSMNTLHTLIQENLRPLTIKLVTGSAAKTFFASLLQQIWGASKLTSTSVKIHHIDNSEPTELSSYHSICQLLKSLNNGTDIVNLQSVKMTCDDPGFPAWEASFNPLGVTIYKVCQ